MNIVDFIILLALIIFVYKLAVKKIRYLNKRSLAKSNSLPAYYGICIAIWNLIAIGILLVLNQYKSLNYSNLIIYLAVILVSSSGLFFVNKSFKARQHLEKLNYFFMLVCTLSTVFITLFIVSTILFETLKFFENIPVSKFLFGTNWNPQNELEKLSESSFGIIPLFAGTFLITIIAILTAAPIGILSAIYLTEYSGKKTRKRIKPLMELLAGIPTVVYGYFAATIICPLIRDLGANFNIEISSESALGAGLVMGIMITPYILSLTDDVINSVPQTLRDASMAIGATKAETILKMILPASMPGICGALLLAISRAIGETMIVTMATGLNANLTLNPLGSVTTVTAQIVSLLTGDQEFNSVKTLSAFALALVLFIVTFILNIFAQIIVSKNKYE